MGSISEVSEYQQEFSKSNTPYIEVSDKYQTQPSENDVLVYV